MTFAPQTTATAPLKSDELLANHHARPSADRMELPWMLKEQAALFDKLRDDYVLPEVDAARLRELFGPVKKPFDRRKSDRLPGNK